MTAATDRFPLKFLSDDVLPASWNVPLAASTTVKRGWHLAKNSAGYTVPFTATTGLTSAGVADQDAGPGASAGDAHVITHGKIVNLDNSTVSGDTLADTDAPCVCWGVDNHTVGKLSVGKSPAGIFFGLDAADGNRARVWVGPAAAAMAAIMVGETDDTTAVRNVVFANVADLTAYTVAASTSLNDNVLNVEGDIVALVAQTTAAECGLYRVGPVASGTAPLTRLRAMATGMTFPNAVTFEVSEGGVYRLSTWKSTATTTGGWKVGTNDPAFYPRTYKQTITLAAGTYTIGVGSTATPDEPLFLLLANATVSIGLNTPNTTTSTTAYCAPVASRTTGKAGAAVLLVRANVAAGTINVADLSTLDITVTNW